VSCPRFNEWTAHSLSRSHDAFGVKRQPTLASRAKLRQRQSPRGLRLAMSGGSARFVGQSERSVTMATGTVKWFNATKGFGFIQPDASGPDVFVHISAVERAGMRELNE